MDQLAFNLFVAHQDFLAKERCEVKDQSFSVYLLLDCSISSLVRSCSSDRTDSKVSN